MALTPCAPCNCISGNIPNAKFKQDVEIIACAILTALTNPDNMLAMRLKNSDLENKLKSILQVKLTAQET